MECDKCGKKFDPMEMYEISFGKVNAMDYPEEGGEPIPLALENESRFYCESCFKHIKNHF
jgi:hypothetical protein